MKKKFKAHSKNKFIKLKLMLWLIVIYLSFITTFNLLLKNSISNIMNNENNKQKIINFGLNTGKLSFNLLNPEDMFKLSLNYVLKVPKTVENNDLFIIDTSENDTNPRVYIYNTHQTESYDSSLLAAYNISYTVQTASFILRDYLKEYGIPSYVENESISTYLSTNGLNYNKSYEASRYYIKKRKEEFSNIEFIIDLHRDSVPASVTRAEINGTFYAKVLFVVGLDHENYESNLKLAERLNSKLDPRLTRGLLKKTGPKVNGVYNQDLSSKSILIEVGGVDNSISDVNNTLKVLSKLIFEELNGE